MNLVKQKNQTENAASSLIFFTPFQNFSHPSKAVVNAFSRTRAIRRRKYQEMFFSILFFLLSGGFGQDIETLTAAPLQIADWSCFTTRVYGWTEEGPPESPFLIELDVSDAFICQILCQAREECAWFLFNWTSRQCFGYTEISLIVASNTIVTNLDVIPHGSDSRWEHCDMNIAYRCVHGFYKCVQCSGEKTCMWHSWNHVTGPKFCPPPDACAYYADSNVQLLIE
eukprot:GHVP01013245.1.p1 GENE.GHVP01013245.1~~GHVP01013245.1.p1  ORF type:complete len:226 (-),score=31.15 GHVP01013245.1:352-1029(-)